MITRGSRRTLGTALRRLVELLDGEVQRAYDDAGLDYRASFTPVMRALQNAESLSVRELADAAGISHAGASSTVTQMRRRGLLEQAESSDGRERRVRLTPAAREMVPQLQTLWRRTRQAETQLNAELGADITDVINTAIEIVERRSFLPGVPNRSGGKDAA
jgi:DNA-binding MarR family transcriptional regulator